MPIDPKTLLECVQVEREMTAAEIRVQYHYDTGETPLEADVVALLTELADYRLITRYHGRRHGVTVYVRPLVVGLGATYCIGSDRYACTVVSVSPNKRKVIVQFDKATRTDDSGMSEDQHYSYERDVSGELKEMFRRRDGRYANGVHGGGLLLGKRSHYYDYSH